MVDHGCQVFAHQVQPFAFAHVPQNPLDGVATQVCAGMDIHCHRDMLTRGTMQGGFVGQHFPPAQDAKFFPHHLPVHIVQCCYLLSHQVCLRKAGDSGSLAVGFQHPSLPVGDQGGVNIVLEKIAVELVSLIQRGIQLGITDRQCCQVGNGAKLLQVLLGKKVRRGVNEGQHSHQLVLGKQGDAQRRFRSRLIRGIVRAAHPAVILAGIGDEYRQAGFHHPACQPAGENFLQLLQGVGMKLFPHHNGGIHWLLAGIQCDEAAALRPQIAG